MRIKKYFSEYVSMKINMNQAVTNFCHRNKDLKIWTDCERQEMLKKLIN